jgi:putative inorganic carbon (HCO3(-)) transporter
MLDISTRKDNNYPPVGNLVLLLFCGYVIIWYLQIGYRKPALGEIRFEFIYAAALSALALAMALGTRIELDCPAVKWTILLFLVIFIQVPLSHNFDHSWNIFIDRVVKFSFMAFFIISFVRSPRHLVFFLAAFLLACLKMGQEGLLGQITGNMVWQNQGVMRLHGSTPLYDHPNSFAGMALGTIPFIIYLFPIVPKYIKAIFVVQLVFALNIVLHTGSRTGYVAFVIMVLFMILKSRNKKKVILLVATLTIIAVPFIDDQYVARFKTVYTGQEIEGTSMDSRKTILEDAVDVFLKYPLGVGVGAFPFWRWRPI